MSLIGKPAKLLILAGSLNGLILPLTLGVVLLAAHRKDIVGDYNHPKWLTIFGILIVIAATNAGIQTFSNMALLLKQGGIMDFKYLISGQNSIILELGNKINEEINQNIRMIKMAIEKEDIIGIIELIPTYRSIKIDYDSSEITYKDLIQKINSIKEKISDINISNPKNIEIPTLYNGIDLDYVCEYNKLTKKEVIKIHSAKKYLIYMLGFTPGFPYLGGMDEKIATPRLNEPRSKIESGSVGIAGSQTGIYPIQSPGGWRIIGKIPLKLFDYKREEPFLFKAGDYLKFKPIDKKRYIEIKQKVDNKTFNLKKIFKEG